MGGMISGVLKPITRLGAPVTDFQEYAATNVASSRDANSRPVVVIFLARAYQTDVRPRLEVETLHLEGYQIIVLAWDRNFEFPQTENIDGATVRSYRIVNLRRFARSGLALGAIILQGLLFLECIRLILRLKRRPLIHANDFNTLLPACVLRILRLASGLVYDCRELTYGVYSEWFNPLIGRVAGTLEERWLPFADKIVTVSEPIEEYLRRFNAQTRLIYNCAKATEVPNLSKSELRKNLGLPLHEFIVSYVGELRYGCKLDLMLEVAALTKEYGVHYLVVGAGPLANEFKRQAATSKIANLSIISQVSRQKAAMYVAASDLSWVLYSKASLNARISMPRKLLDSIVTGVPVLVDRGTLSETVVRRIGCGVVLDNDTPRYVSHVIISLLNDPNRFNDMSIAAKLAGKEYTWEIMSRKLVETYSGLRNETRPRTDRTTP